MEPFAAANAGDRLVLAMHIVAVGDLESLADQWAQLPPSLWVSLSATSPNDCCLKWIAAEKQEGILLAGFANAMTARLDAGCTNPSITRGAMHLRAWQTRV